MGQFEDEVRFVCKVLSLIEAEGPRGDDGKLVGMWGVWEHRLIVAMEQSLRENILEKGKESIEKQAIGER